MSSKLLVAASVSLTQCAAVAEASLRGDPNQVGYAVDRFDFISTSLSLNHSPHAQLTKSRYNAVSAVQGHELAGVAPHIRGPTVGDCLGLRRPLRRHRLGLHQVRQGGL